jgi:hypothetical protein
MCVARSRSVSQREKGTLSETNTLLFFSFWQQITFGWKYLVARPGLLGLVMFIAISNFLVGSAEALTTPLVLSFASAQSLGTIYSISSFRYQRMSPRCTLTSIHLRILYNKNLLVISN